MVDIRVSIFSANSARVDYYVSLLPVINDNWGLLINLTSLLNDSCICGNHRRRSEKEVTGRREKG